MYRVLLLLSCLALPAAHASVRIETLQMPAWVERAGEAQPLGAGVALQPGDVLRTGSAARLVLRLDEGSAVELGENAQFAVRRYAVEQDQWGRFRGLFELVRGAFRFTTGVLGAQRRRDIRIQVGTVTVAIGGTDIWGRAGTEEDLVCLIEGDIEVARGAQQLRLDQPLSVYRAPRAGDPLPLSAVDPRQMARWAQQTEPQAGGGVVHEDGLWQLHLGAARAPAGIERLVGELRDAGYAAVSLPAQVQDETWQRALLPGFVTRADAEAPAAGLRARFNLSSTWVSRTR